MGLDVYVGPLTRYTLGEWLTIVQQAGLDAGQQVEILRANPSPDDVALTTRMVRAGSIMGIDVLDHVILADQRYFSFAESGQLPPDVTVRAATGLAERAG